jgi:hypothetical protein
MSVGFGALPPESVDSVMMKPFFIFTIIAFFTKFTVLGFYDAAVL